MKTSKDPRHLRRRSAVEALFSYPYQPDRPVESKLAAKVIGRRRKIDGLIAAAAPEWGIDKINRVDLAILRLAVWELAVEKKTPLKVVVDEAVELAKRYGAEGSPGFINGVLGTVAAKLQITNDK